MSPQKAYTSTGADLIKLLDAKNDLVLSIKHIAPGHLFVFNQEMSQEILQCDLSTHTAQLDFEFGTGQIYCNRRLVAEKLISCSKDVDDIIGRWFSEVCDCDGDHSSDSSTTGDEMSCN